MRIPSKQFVHCPRCGAALDTPLSPLRLHCVRCDFIYYFGPTVSVAVLLHRPDRKTLFIVRSKPPAQHKLGVPGGFVDIGESAEQALQREVREEVGLEIASASLLCSRPNEYPYRGVTYPVLDLYFTAPIALDAEPHALDGVSDCVWKDPLQLDFDELAFPSLRQAVELYAKGLSSS